MHRGGTKGFAVRLFHDESGQGMVEYGLILGLIAIAVVVAVAGTGTQVTGIHTRYHAAITAACGAIFGT